MATVVSKRNRKQNPVVEAHPLSQLDCITVNMDWDGVAWVTNIPELYGISTFGDTQEAALDLTQEMLLGWLDSMEARGMKIPLSRSQIGRIRETLA